MYHIGESKVGAGGVCCLHSFLLTTQQKGMENCSANSWCYYQRQRHLRTPHGIMFANEVVAIIAVLYATKTIRVTSACMCGCALKYVHKIAFERENLRKAPRRMSLLSLLRWRVVVVVVVVCSSIKRFTCNRRILHFHELRHKLWYFTRTA